MTKAFQLFDLVKTYPGFQLGPLNFDLEPGLVLGYIGPNGSGKTTTMHCIAGLVRPDNGEIRVFDRPNHPDEIDWKFDIGYVGDAHVFYERWTAERNLSFLSQFYPAWSNGRAQDLARRFRLPLQRKAKDLSTGNRVKLSLVGVLARSPRLLLLDEPTAGLDPVVRTEVLDTLFEVLENGECSIFYSTHILSDISRLADELAFLNEGKLMLRAPKEDLTEDWRRISFRYSQERLPEIAGLVKHEVDGSDHQVMTSDQEATIAALRGLGVEAIQVNRLTIDEIAVQILKGGIDVVAG